MEAAVNWTASRTATAIALALLLVLTWVLAKVKRTVNIAQNGGTYTPAGGTERSVKTGDEIPANDVKLAEAAKIVVKPVDRTVLRSLAVGTDNRLSTSKTVALTWTYVIAFALISILVAKWLGRGAGFAALKAKGLQEEYLIALGGPYAAAVLAKYSAVSASQSEGKPAAAAGTAGTAQLVANDAGDGDLGDFQYVLFNAIAIVWVVVTFVLHPGRGLPDIPAVLAGLALTSAAAYSAKKLVSAAPPSLTSLLPPEAEQKGGVQLFGKNLVLPGTGPQDPMQVPTLMIGNHVVDATRISSSPGGIDRLSFSVPEKLDPGPYLVSAVRADGVAAGAPGGASGLPLQVTGAAKPTPATKKQGG
jgi:hypothetical protein